MGRGRKKFGRRDASRVASYYGLQGVSKNSRVALMRDLKYHRASMGWRTGTIRSRVSRTVWVEWDDDPDNLESFDESQMRYWVDTSRCRITGPEPKHKSPIV